MMLGRRRDREDSAADAAGAEAVLASVSVKRDRLLAAIDAVSDAVVIADATGTVVHRSAAAARFEEARHGDAVAADLLDRLLGRACSGEPGAEELTLHGPPRRVLAVRAEPLVVGCEVLGAIGTVSDVTELHYVRDVRRDFVANVSHELKTPIGALALLAETFAATEHPETAKRLSDQILRETDRLVRIVDDLLDLSLIEAQEAPIREHVPVHVLLHEAIERVRALALAQGKPLRYEEPPRELMIECDPAKLLSAITNLLDNAVKYSEEGGTIELFTEKLEGRVVIVVRDHGIGIPSRDLERIFERFYRVDKARSRVTGGTGLGLSIVRHVAQAHGGDVSVESTEGQGSTFRLALPMVGPLDGPARVRAEAS
jgi:two-component system sensor histidine kinase SenX3